RLLSMLDPTGIMAVVNSVIAFYRAVESAIEYLRQILEIVDRWFDTLAGIASGAIGAAANMLEGLFARAIPVAIGFLANQVGLSGLGRRIREMIEAVREKVAQAIDWLIGRALAIGQRILDTILGRPPPGAPPGAPARGGTKLSQWRAARGAARRPLLAELRDIMRELYTLMGHPDVPESKVGFSAPPGGKVAYARPLTRKAGAVKGDAGTSALER